MREKKLEPQIQFHKIDVLDPIFLISFLANLMLLSKTSEIHNASALWLLYFVTISKAPAAFNAHLDLNRIQR